jgi:thioredoxin family protein
VTLVEFSDYQCPYCRRLSATTARAIKKDYIDTGKPGSHVIVSRVSLAENDDVSTIESRWRGWHARALRQPHLSTPGDT